MEAVLAGRCIVRHLGRKRVPRQRRVHDLDPGRHAPDYIDKPCPMRLANSTADYEQCFAGRARVWVTTIV